MLIHPYSPHWNSQFDAIKQFLDKALQGINYRIEHIGSTAVPGLAAKPIIDIDIVYKDPIDFHSIKTALEVIGYSHKGNQGIEDREVFKRQEGGQHEVLDSIRHHLYVCSADSPALQRHLITRDYLRNNEWAKAEYQQLKYDLAEKAGQDQKSYAALKELHVNSLIDKFYPTIENIAESNETTESTKTTESTDTMEVHHHAHHDHGKKNWKSYFWEFFMLFLAVFCGFLAEYQLEHKIENDRAKELAKSLYTELYEDSIRLNKVMELRLEKELALKYLMQYFAKADFKQEADSAIRAMAFAYITVSNKTIFEPTDGVLIQLQSSGSRRYFKKQSIQDAISKLYSSIHFIRMRNERELLYMSNSLRTFYLKHLDYMWLEQFMNSGKLSVADAYLRKNPVNEIKPFFKKPEQMDRDEAINLAGNLLLMMRGIKLTTWPDYRASATSVMSQLRQEYDFD
ncbi:GrpB family protein [Sediminibacterium sp. TEGAF015]|uniref:GrpB family protein n=1 Tax=Sediminibacterium sp. TEGAF015 TaxID=575378 RepID=UPI00220975C2|nr:GrpB family protein [Sediminibacterium sp. TEGAF015]BDQ12048.1 hypothetical protein TEGAF0_12650 [Sediminibacterium sp. TEGAF015]